MRPATRAPRTFPNPFQSTHSLRSATWRALARAIEEKVSIHALLAECDLLRRRGGRHQHGFNPRTPCGVRRKAELGNTRLEAFQSTHSLRSATVSALALWRVAGVSIHALLAECDLYPGFGNPGCRSFNPRTPCGVRPTTPEPVETGLKFQSTHSLRSATDVGFTCGTDEEVSIHALLAECDRAISIADYRPHVSIHALLAECDMLLLTRYHHIPCFNPRTPCGVRRHGLFHQTPCVTFQSTHSLRSATSPNPLRNEFGNVSIHALLAECDKGLSKRT